MRKGGIAGLPECAHTCYLDSPSTTMRDMEKAQLPLGQGQGCTALTPAREGAVLVPPGLQYHKLCLTLHSLPITYPELSQ